MLTINQKRSLLTLLKILNSKFVIILKKNKQCKELEEKLMQEKIKYLQNFSKIREEAENNLSDQMKEKILLLK